LDPQREEEEGAGKLLRELTSEKKGFCLSPYAAPTIYNKEQVERCEKGGYWIVKEGE